MLNDKTKNAIREFLEEADSDTLFSVINEIYNETGDLEYLVWNYMAEFNELCSSLDPHDIALAIYYGDFRPNDMYFQHDGNGNFVSCDYISLDSYDINEVIDAIEMMPERYIPFDIKTIIEENEEEEED